MVVLRQTAAQSVPNATWTAVTFDTEDLDRDNGHSTVSNTSRYTATSPGYFWWAYSLTWAANATGQRGGRIRTNGTDAQVSAVARVLHNAGATFDTGQSGGGAQYMNGTTDYVELMGFQNSGGALNTNIASDGVPRLQAIWVSS